MVTSRPTDRPETERAPRSRSPIRSSLMVLMVLMVIMNTLLTIHQHRHQHQLHQYLMMIPFKIQIQQVYQMHQALHQYLMMILSLIHI